MSEPHGIFGRASLAVAALRATSADRDRRRTVDRLDDLDVATCGWVSWFNAERIHGELGDRSPAVLEAAYYRHPSQPDAA
jgi:transposase InsO family protein